MKRLSLCIFLLFSLNVFSQGFLDNVSGELTTEDLVTEKIQKISPTKRIFVLSNDNNSFNIGDYISIVFLDKITARAIVARAAKNFAGIKIIKINSWSHWQKLIPGANVQIITGDDSKFKSAKKKKEETEDEGLAVIQDDNDFYNDVVIEDDVLQIEENKNRHIKQDNLVTLNYGQIQSIDASSSSASYQQFIISYGYQLRDNMWLEGSYGQNIIRDFPSSGIDTTLRQISGKIKYTFKIPFYCYLMPYVGISNASGESPQAGLDPTGNTSDSELQGELQLVDALSKNSVIFGVTLVRHLAPGWYARLDLGNDAISGGFGLEF